MNRERQNRGNQTTRYGRRAKVLHQITLDYRRELIKCLQALQLDVEPRSYATVPVSRYIFIVLHIVDREGSALGLVYHMYTNM
ncbi:hypothetical protein KP509_07G100900 [Ceratopteris richardii]|uniref:Uncharacterized protein n=1 Tax=Ceratopteris richardii TaxID=49495 RepID=A0A8T2UDN5_CERRI|nr:hypothetical protein KP509_07G100900 [Ceratopteris richardii]